VGVVVTYSRVRADAQSVRCQGRRLSPLLVQLTRGVSGREFSDAEPNSYCTDAVTCALLGHLHDPENERRLQIRLFFINRELSIIAVNRCSAGASCLYPGCTHQPAILLIEEFPSTGLFRYRAGLSSVSCKNRYSVKCGTQKFANVRSCHWQ
jgi:hypothetical protein